MTATGLTRLKSGLRVATYNLPHAHSVSVGIWVGAGARDETESEQGIAHMLEHMAFKGTHKRTAQQIAIEVENVGGYMNAHTSREETAYYIRVLPEHTELALDILVDIVGNSTLPEDEIERERGVIIQEIGQAMDTPDDLVFDRFTSACYHNQSFGKAILGTVDTVSGFSQADLHGFLQRHYGAQQMLIVAAGPVEHDAFVAMVEAASGTITMVPGAARQTPKWTAGTDIVQRDLEQTHILFGLPCAGAASEDRFATMLLSNLYGGGMSSRLFQQVREERGLCYSIFSFAQMYSDGGVLGVYAGTSPEQADEMLHVASAALTDIISALDEAELNRAKAQLRAALLMGQESVTGMAESLARQILLRGEPTPTEVNLAGIDSVSVADIQALVVNLLNDSAPVLATVGPSAQMMDHIALQGLLRP